MKNLRTIPVAAILFLLATVPLKAQKRVSELTMVYDYSVGVGNAEPRPGVNGENATHTVYIKGNKSRSEMSNPLFSSTTLYDANTGQAVILKEVSGQKLLIHLTSANWQERSAPYEGIEYKNTGETKEIAGYKCVKAVGTTKAGATITVYYTRDIIPENRDYDPQFRTLEGLPMEYELTNGDVKIKYMITRINLNPVPASKFDIPKSGYREMNYEDSKKI
jgi:GLPGLI family protein